MQGGRALVWLDEDRGCVSVEQWRGALRTYLRPARDRRAIRHVALELAELLAGGPGMSRTARWRFIDELEGAPRRQHRPGRAEPPVFDPAGVGPGRYAPQSVPTGFAWLLA